MQRADKQTGARQPAVNYALAHIGKPYDLVNVPEECPNVSNTCQVTQLAKFFGCLLSSFKCFRGSHAGVVGCACLMGEEVTHVNERKVVSQILAWPLLFVLLNLI